MKRYEKFINEQVECFGETLPLKMLTEIPVGENRTMILGHLEKGNILLPYNILIIKKDGKYLNELLDKS